MSSNNEDPSSAPERGRWYNIALGSSFKDNHHTDHPPKFCTFRYEFKPASIDTSQPGTLHKSKDNRVTLEFQNNQHGKPKVVFEGVSEDYKDNDAVLFFDRETFRLERLHRAKRLRHVRLPGEPVAGAASTMSTLVVPAVESHSSPVGKGKIQPLNTVIVHETVQAEQIKSGNSTSLGAEPETQKDVQPTSHLPDLSMSPSDTKKLESEEHVDIANDNDDSSEIPKKGDASEKEFRTGLDIDINLPHPVGMDDEIADVDVNDDEPDKGPNAAEALRAQVNAEAQGRNQPSSSSSSSSESESSDTESGSASGSGSGSASSSSDSESSYGGSVNSI